MAAAAPLTDTHRSAQLALRARVLRDLQLLWPAMDWQDIDRTLPLWADAIEALVRTSRATSASLASSYLQAFRLAAGITGTAPVVTAAALPAEQLATVLRVTTAAAVKAATARGVNADRAMANAFVRSSGEITRLVLDGGRDTIRQTVAQDPECRGWERVGSGSACDFCQMLIGRGAVYKADTAKFASHGHCACTPQPVYRTDVPAARAGR